MGGDKRIDWGFEFSQVFPFHISLQVYVSTQPFCLFVVLAFFGKTRTASKNKMADADVDIDASVASVARVDPSWRTVLIDALRAQPGLLPFVSAARRDHTVYPQPEHVFRALELPVSSVRVCIIGQDPYHSPNQAHGLAFSVPHGVTIPPSLRNILQEAGVVRAGKKPSGDLSSWAHQGVLLLNTVLTVERDRAASHSGRGWEQVTTALLRHLSSTRHSIVFMLWGRHAQALRSAIVPNDHLIIEAPHPSPLSAARGFFGCGHFEQANAFLLKDTDQLPIDWSVGS